MCGAVCNHVMVRAPYNMHCASVRSGNSVPQAVVGTLRAQYIDCWKVLCGMSRTLVKVGHSACVSVRARNYVLFAMEIAGHSMLFVVNSSAALAGHYVNSLCDTIC